MVGAERAGGAAHGGVPSPRIPSHTSLRMSRLPLAALALLVAACGSVAGQAVPVPCGRPPRLPAPAASAAPVSATASAGEVVPGGSVTFTEAIAGPATVQVGCSSPLQLVVTDGTGLAVYSGGAPAVTGPLCGAVAVAAGQSRSYQVTWAVDPTLPGGAYTAALVLGDAPQLSLTVAVGVRAPACRRGRP